MERIDTLEDWVGYTDCDIENRAPDSDTIVIYDNKSYNVYIVSRDADGTAKVTVEFHNIMREHITVDLTLGSDGGTVIVREA